MKEGVFMREFRKIVSGLLAVCLLVSMLPRYAWATEPEPTEPPESVASTAPTAPAPTAPPETEPPESLEPEEPEPEPTEPPETEPIGSGTPDGTPPVLHSLELSATSVTVPGSISFSWSASDDVSGVSGIMVAFVHIENGRELVSDETPSVDKLSGTFSGTISTHQNTPPGEYVLQYIGIIDIAGNVLRYSENPDVGIPIPDAFKDLKFTVVNNNALDQTPPELKGIFLDSTSMSAPGEISIAVDAIDDGTGLAHISVGFYCEEVKQGIGTGNLTLEYDQETGLYHGAVKADEYDFPGIYKISYVFLEDYAGNYIEYVSDPFTADYGTPIPDEMRSLTFEVTDSVSPDNIAPTINGITFSAPTVMAPGAIEMYIDASDDNSGIGLIKGAFYCEETNKYLHFGEATPNCNKETGKYHLTIEVGQYEPSGIFVLDGLVIQDRAENGIMYDRGYTSNDPAIAELLEGVQFTVINRGADVTTSVSKDTFVDEIANADSDAYIAADYSGDATMPKEAFDAIKGTDKTIDLISEGITWRFEGSDITQEIKDIDLKVDIQKVEEDSSASGDAIEDNLKGNPGVVMKFPENGTLPGKATIQVKVDYAMREYLGSSEGLSVYYYNNQTGELELIASNLKVINDTYVEFPITHCSYYVLTPSPVVEAPVEPEEPATPSGSVVAVVDKTNFPDDNFRAWILEQDYGKDGVLKEGELYNVTHIDISRKEIKDLTGIEYFVALQHLYCSSNQLTSLDVSQNTALINLLCGGNQLTSLDVGSCIALTVLNCGNNLLTNLNISGCTALMNLYCENNQLTSLDTSKNTALLHLNCASNQLVDLNMSGNQKLTELTCSNNQLTNLDVSNCTALTGLYCDNNKLTALELSKNAALIKLFCYKNQLTELNLSGKPNLLWLHCYDNQLTKLIVRKNMALEHLACDGNQLTELDISQNIELKELACGINQIESLDVTNCTKLEYLECDDNKITELDLSNNPLLTELSCDGNLLTVLDLSKNTKLKDLQCCGNQLVSLDLSSNPKCSEVTATGNRRQIKLNSDNTFVLSTLPGFDISKATKWTGGIVSNGVLTALSRTITYSYQINSNETVMFTLQASNYNPNVGKMEGKWGDLNWNIDVEEVLTISGTGEMLHYSDPNGDPDNSNPVVDGYPWHKYEDFIITVIVKEGVTTLAESAFHGLENLRSVTLPGGLTSIGNAAFSFCPELKSVRIPATVTSIGKEIFYECTGMKQVIFAGNAPTFDPAAFGDVTLTAYYPAENETWTADVRKDYGGHITWVSMATSGTCGDNLTWTLDDEGTLTISGTGAMEDYPSVSSDGILEDIAPWYYHEVKKAVLSEGITYIGKSAFMDQARMTAVEIPKSVTGIGTRAFCGCSSLTGVTLPETVTDIGVSAFLACEKLSSINIPANITVINDFAFAHCSRLSNVTIPAGVTRLGDNAFLYSGLRRISIPEKVTSIGGSAFAGCSNLAEIIFTGNAPKISDGAFVDVRATAYYPANDSTWTNKVMQSYGGNIQWVVQQDLKELYLFYNYHQPIAVGETVRIDISCSPRGASVDPVYSTSSRSEIIEKDATGVVIKALSAGITTVSVTDTITGKKDEVSIRIVEPVKIGAPCSEIYDSTNPRSGDPYSFTPKKTGQYVFSLENFDDPTLETYIDVTKYTENSPGSSWLPIEWELSARNSFRRVYTLEAGESYLIRLMHMGLGLQSGAVFRVSEVVPVTGIDIPEEEKTVWFCDANSGLNVTANVQPINAVGEIEWSSSDPSVMVIEGIGGATTYIRVNKPGTAVITATCGNYSDSVTVTAKEPPVLTLNTPVTDVCQLGDYKVFSFTAPEDGYYAASVTAEEELYIGDGGQGDNDSAGRLLRNLKAGEIWYIQVSGNPASDAKPYTIQVTQPAAPKNMSLRFEVGYSGNVNVRPVFVPENAFDPIVSCTVSDPEILEDGPMGMCPIYASYRILEPGEVTVTVTTESGLKATETITVSRLGANVSWLLEEDVLTVFGWNFMQADKSDLWKEVLKKTRVVRFEGGITDLPVEGFSSSSIKEVHLPASMKDIRCCFLLCENLEKITLQEPNYSYNVVDGVLFNEDGTSLFLYPAKKDGSSYAIPDGVSHIEFSALQNAVNLETVTIPDSVAFIQSKAFEGCTGLKEIVIPASVTDMGENVFHGCSSLQSVTVAGNPNLYWGVFSDCTALKEITFQGDAPTFGDETFRNVTATAYYPADNATWTDDVMQGYGGDITWKPYCPNAHSFGQWVTQGSESSRVCTICGYTEYKMVTDGGDVEIGAPEQPNLDFDVDHVEPSDQKYVLVEEAVNEAGDAEREVLKVFDITLKNGDGYHVQPNGSVKVKLPLDWDKEGNYKVYRVNDDKSLTDMSAYRQGSHMVFETDHFSLYIIVEEASAAMGDLNLDGEVDASDLTLLARHVAKIELLQGAALTNADVDSDGDVDAEDLTVHARYVAKIITQWP